VLGALAEPFEKAAIDARQEGLQPQGRDLVEQGGSPDRIQVRRYFV
jgi:hypothetical protein